MFAEDERRPPDEVPFDLPDGNRNPWERPIPAAAGAAADHGAFGLARAGPGPRAGPAPLPGASLGLVGVAAAVGQGAERLAGHVRRVGAVLTRLATDHTIRGRPARARPFVFAAASLEVLAQCLLTLRRPSGRPSDVECAAEALRLMRVALAGAGPLAGGTETLRAWRDALDLAAAAAEAAARLPLAAAGFAAVPRLLRSTARALAAAADAAARTDG